MSAPALELSDLAFAWPGRPRFTIEVSGFRLERGERVLLLGASGSGKSTLLSLICGILLPRAGTIHIAGQEMTGLGGAQRDRLRAEQIGVIFQQFNLLPYASALDNILLPLRFAPQRRARAGAGRVAALALTAALGLPKDLVTRAPARSLSVGQQQRAAVARALIGAPPLIVADEPTSALDAEAQSAFLDLLFAQCAQAAASLLMVSHDPSLQSRFDRTLRLEEIARVTREADAA